MTFQTTSEDTLRRFSIMKDHLDAISRNVAGQFRDEYLNGELFYTLAEAKILIERWRRQYNEFRPHSSRGYRPPAPETTLSRPPAIAPRQQPAWAFGLT